MTRISVEEAGEKLAVLVAAVQSGEDVILLQNNIAVARLVPDESSTPLPSRRKPGSARNKGYEFALRHNFDAPLDEFTEYQ